MFSFDHSWRNKVFGTDEYLVLVSLHRVWYFSDICLSAQIAVHTLKLVNLLGVSRRLDPNKGQIFSPRKTRSKSRQQQSSQDSKSDQDRIGEQASASSQCCPVPAVTCSSSSQPSQTPAAISLPTSIPGVENLNFDPPTHCWGPKMIREMPGVENPDAAEECGWCLRKL